MEQKRLKNFGFEYQDKSYEFGFTLNEVKELANFSLARGGRLNDLDFIRFALKKYSNAGFITEKTIKEIHEGLVGGIEYEDSELTYEEFIQYLMGLFGQAIDDEARKVTPAIINIEKDNTVNVTIGDETYKLMFTRDSLDKALADNVFDSNNLLEMYVVGSTMIRAALQHYDKRLRVTLHDQIFLSLWATMFNEETANDLSEVLNALNYHMKDVVDSGIKKSKAPIKMTPR